MFITKMSLPRRTFLRGMGATLALPLLDAMVPALTRASAQTAGATRARGSAPSTCRTARSWTSGRRRPSGADFEFTPILKPLEPFRDSADGRVSNLCDPRRRPRDVTRRRRG